MAFVAGRHFQSLQRAAALLLVAAAAALAGLSPAGAPALAQATVAKDARLGGDEQRTRFVTDLSREVSFRLFTLADPYRVIVDLPDVKFQLPTGLGKKGRGLVSAYRYGLIAKGKARIVVDVKAPVLVDKAFVLPPKDGQPARLVIDMLRTDRKTFMATLRRDARAPAAAAKRPSGPAVTPPSAKKRTRRHAKPVIVIDPGHGGIDPGAVSRSGLKEKDVVFAFSKTLRKKLLATKRYEVALTRTIDSYIALRDRVAFARKRHGDLFLSIHADSIPGRYSKKVRGATVYTLSEKASDAEARALAAKENRSDVIAGVELPQKQDKVTGILIDLAQRETKNLSIAFAEIIIDNLKGKTPLMTKAHRFAGFRVLKAPDIPSVLIELGYMSNPADTRKMTTAAWRDKVANAIVASIDRYFSSKARGFGIEPRLRRSSRAN